MTSRTPDLDALRAEYIAHLDYERINKRISPRTVAHYARSSAVFIDWLRTKARPLTARAVSRADIEGFAISLQQRGLAPATVSLEYRSLQQFFRWLTEEGHIRTNPYAGLRGPKVPVEPKPILSVIDIRKMLAVCHGTGFRARRDTLVISILFTTGMRMGELTGLRKTDLDFDRHVITIPDGKTGARETIFEGRTIKDARDYLRVRTKHPFAIRDALWLGPNGPMTQSGLQQVIERRAAQAGLEGVHPHLFRSAFAHHSLADGLNEGDVMKMGGWKTRAMLDRYAAALAKERSFDAYRERGPARLL